MASSMAYLPLREHLTVIESAGNQEINPGAILLTKLQTLVKCHQPNVTNVLFLV